MLRLGILIYLEYQRPHTVGGCTPWIDAICTEHQYDFERRPREYRITLKYVVTHISTLYHCHA